MEAHQDYLKGPANFNWNLTTGSGAEDGGAHRSVRVTEREQKRSSVQLRCIVMIVPDQSKY